MSGGIDSAVVAVLCQRAFPEDCLGVLMPCHSDPRDEEHANLVAAKFAIPTRLVPLDSVDDALLDVLHADAELARGKRTAETNARVRLRMVTLYYHAELENLLVLGTIYLGLATPTESAAMGACMSVIFAALYRRLTFDVFKRAALSALKITCWAMLIVMGAYILSVGLAYLRVPAQLAGWVGALEVKRMVILAFVVLLYILLGMFIEAVSMMLLTLAVIYPMMMALGFDSIWFGVMMVVFIEMGQITPPVGVNLYVIHGITGKKHLGDIIVGVIPFFLCQILLLALLTAFPTLALWLPEQMIQKW